MKTKSIHFPPPVADYMVRAILDDRKMVMRRPLKPQPPQEFIQAQDVNGEWFCNDKLGDNDMMEWWPSYEKGVAPPYRPGDILYVRETFHMPREAARIFLRVTDVRVERLKDMTALDIVFEGFRRQRDFIALWDSTVNPADCARYGWAANPWVWVIEFERISREEAIQI